MNASPNLTFKQPRFVEEYQLDGNGTQAVLRAGYKTKHPAEMAYGLLRNNKIKHTLQDAQNAQAAEIHLSQCRNEAHRRGPHRIGWLYPQRAYRCGSCLSHFRYRWRQPLWRRLLVLFS